MNRDDDSATLIFEGPPEKFGFARFSKNPTTETEASMDELHWKNGFWVFPSRALAGGDRMVSATTETTAVPGHRVYRLVSPRTIPASEAPTEPPVDASITFEDMGETTAYGGNGTWLLRPLEYDRERDYWTIDFLNTRVLEGGNPTAATVRVPNHRVYHVDGHEF